MRTAKVSIIIPCFNAEKVIERLLRSIASQTYTDCETIVIDDGSSDKTVALAGKHQATVFKRRHAERSVQRNFGAAKATGKYLLFLDADMELTPEIVDQCVQAMESNSMLGAVAIPEESISVTLWEKVKAFERSFYSLEGDPETDAARFFSRQAFFEAGGYDKDLTGPEDWDLPDKVVKLGYTIGRIKSRMLHYEHIPSLLKLLQKKYYYALSAHKYFSKHQLSIVGAKSIYFLRPVFYKNWRRLLSQPYMTIGMTFVLLCEQLVGLAGYIVGRLTNR